MALAVGGVVALAVPAAATTTADLFGPHKNQTAESHGSIGSCPDLEQGQDGWHFVLRGNSTTFVSLTASFDSNGDTVADTDVSAPGPDGTVGPPTAKHAYVYTPAGWTLVDATAQVNGTERIFNLSHTCPGDGTGNPGPKVPTVVKEASSRYTKTYDWTVGKKVDKSSVTAIGATHTANYTIDVTKSAPVLSGFEVFGSITITNPNSVESGIGLTITDVTDELHQDGSATCAPDPLFVTPFDLAPGNDASIDYVCSFADSTDPTLSGTNAATVSSKAGNEVLPSVVSNDAEWSFGDATVTTVNDSANLSDSLVGALGSFTGSSQVTYPLQLIVPATGCATYNNTATLTFETGSKTSSATVKVCRPTNDGGYTIGFWQNKNGQEVVKTNATASRAAIVARYNKSTAPLLSALPTLSATPTNAQKDALAKWVYDTVKAPVAKARTAMFDKQYLANVLSTVKTPALLTTCIKAPNLSGEQVLSIQDYQLYVKANYAAIVANDSLREAVKDTFDSVNNNAQGIYAC